MAPSCESTLSFSPSTSSTPNGQALASSTLRVKLFAAWLSVVLGCSGDEEASHDRTLSLDQLKDPETCNACHERHYREWRSSMHAYATDDPVFLAMNHRGQDEAALGDFCARCHAPMAMVEGYSDFRALEELPRHLKGVTCYFCHSVQGVGEPHNNSLEVSASNDTLFGPYANPHEAAPHRAQYSPYLDGRQPASSRLCGSCHDIVTPRGVHLERTYEEWQQSNLGALGCARGCHMQGRSDTAVSGVEAPAGTPFRSLRSGEGVHDHLFAGVDSALVEWAADDPALVEVQRAAIRCELANAVQVTEVCLSPAAGGYRLAVSLEAVGVGHAWPSGSALDRRAWLEVRAYSAGEVLFESAVGPEESVESVRRLPLRQLFVMRDYGYDAQGREAHMFWEMQPSEQYPKGYESQLIPAGDLHSVTAVYRLPAQLPDRIEAVVRLRALGKDFLEDLYDSGYLSPEDHFPIETLTLSGTAVRWLPERDQECRRNPEVQSPPFDCRSDYTRMLQ